MWVILGALPPFLWIYYAFRTIGNHLGHFMEAGMSFMHIEERGMGRILVILNPREGVAEEINIKYMDFFYTQIIDYEQLPFC